MARSEFVRLVAYHTIDGHVDRLPRLEAQEKLERELALYRKWRGADVGFQLVRPWIEHLDAVTRP